MNLRRPDVFDMRVAGVRLPTGTYPQAADSHAPISSALDRIGGLLGWATPAGGGGAFGAVIPDGAKVVVKPNWVQHYNQGPWGLEPLLTHASVIRAVIEQVLRTRPASVILGDAPIQACDFTRLLADTGIGHWAAELCAADPRFAGVRDFRRTTCAFENGRRRVREDLVPLDQFVLFDLAGDSLLEPVTTSRDAFRVTQYDPAKMARTHGAGRHQYLIARDIIDADVIVNLPKLKTHKKAGVTCALKNLIGINGNKEYLPHHRVGGADSGGDCYPGASRVKRVLEFAYDRLNTARSEASARQWAAAVRVLHRVAVMQGDKFGVEGSWSGNDTIWRTCLDLNRILLYGRTDGSMADVPQRRVLNIVDAIVVGHGDGPLAPQPAPMGILLAGSNSAAVDRIGAQLLGYETDLIPIVRRAFDEFRWPLVRSAASQTEVTGDLHRGQHHLVERPPSVPLVYPVGWVDAVSRDLRRPTAAVSLGSPVDA